MNKNQELEELFQTVRQIYIKNIKFLQKEHRDIYLKIKNFEALQIENYLLEFKNNHFELVDKNGFEFYKCNPFYDAQKRCEKLEEKPSFNLLKSKKIESGVHYNNSINANEFINDFLELQNDDDIKHDKFIFLGTLLGVHLNDLAKVLGSNVYLICENNLEIFRLSLFLTDYEDLNKNAKLFFCVEEDEHNFKYIIRNFLNYKTQYNHKISFEIADINSIHFINKIKDICIDYDPYNYPFSEYLTSLKRAIHYKGASKYGILNCNIHQNIFTKPILFLGAGPSLASSIEWVYTYQDAFIIVCAAACLKRLELLDIVPDIILSADGQFTQVIRQFEVNEKYYKNSIIIASAKTDLNITRIFNYENSYFIADNLEVFENSGIFTGVSVGDVGLDFLLRFGVKEIYMLGFDAAFSQDGQSHDNIYKEQNYIKEKIIVKGNFEKEVATNLTFFQLIEQINIATSKATSDVKIFNLSNGAYFENTTPLKKENIDFTNFSNLNKDEIFDGLKKSFTNISSKMVTQKDLNLVKQELKILKKLKSVKVDRLEIEFRKIASSHQNLLTIQIINNFFNLILPYNSYKNSKEAQELLYGQFCEILEDLQNSFKSIKEEK